MILYLIVPCDFLVLYFTCDVTLDGLTIQRYAACLRHPWPARPSPVSPWLSLSLSLDLAFSLLFISSLSSLSLAMAAMTHGRRQPLVCRATRPANPLPLGSLPLFLPLSPGSALSLFFLSSPLSSSTVIYLLSQRASSVPNYPIEIGLIPSEFSGSCRGRAKPLRDFLSAFEFSLQAFHAPPGGKLSSQHFIAKLV